MSQQDCKSIQELLPAYSVGATTPEETARVEEMLLECPEIIDELTDYLMLSDMLRETIHGDNNTHHRTTPAHTQQPAALSSTPANSANGQHTASSTEQSESQTSAESEPAWRKKLRTDTTGQSSSADTNLIQFPSRWLVWLPVAASVLVLLVVGISSLYWSSMIQNLQTEQARLMQELSTQREQPLLVGDFMHRTLPATDDGLPESHATLVWDPETFIASLYAAGLPELEESHHYTVWGVKEGHHTHLGYFNVDTTGEGILLFQASTPLESFDAIGINIEPLTSRDTPTTPHLIIGEI